ncbi:MAG: hypothetical protein EXS32_06035 [Opitutus sp.]|nr:hypothetical protein [Opitutus sp.]
MNAPEAGKTRSVLLRLLGSKVRVACAVCVGIFLWAVAQFYDPATGFSNLIAIGDAITERQVTALRQVPHYIYEDSPGYDGAWYVQLAFYPTLDNPELTKAIDNLPYRARRMLFSWTAWLLGLGQPAWIVQAFALLNVIAWLALAWVLLRWFPPTTWENFFRWFAIMFSHGLCMSVHNSLVDGPALLLLALGLAAIEDGRRGRGAVALALAGLGKETSLLAVVGLPGGDWREWRTWWRLARTALLVALPLFAWMGYVRGKFGPAEDGGLGNFTWPFAGLAEKWGATIGSLPVTEDRLLHWTTLGVTVALTVQFLFFALRWRPDETWWRVGAAFALMMMFLATPVWEDFPGAATRVLLPMTLAFNLLVPRGRRWLAVIIAGNLTVFATYKEFEPPPREFFQILGPRATTATVTVEPAGGWYGPEGLEAVHWRWSSGESVLRLSNRSSGPLAVVLRGRANALDRRTLRIFADEAMVWSGALAPTPTEFQLGFVAPPGERLIRFSAAKAPTVVGTDPRKLSFSIYNLEVVVKPAAGQR